MADFKNLALTVSGVKALLAAQMGTTLTLSKIGLGSGFANNSTSLTALVTPEVMLPISEKKIDDVSGYLTIVAKMTNEDIAEGFYWRETGLFFEDSEGNDVLFAYACVDDKYDYVPAYSDQRYIKHVRIANIITDSADITVKENEGLLYVDTLTFNKFKEDLERDLNEIKSDLSFDKFKEDLENDLNEIKSDLSDAYSSESTYAVGDYCIYGNLLYKCTEPIDTAEEFNIEHWQRTNIAKELSEKSSNALTMQVGGTEPTTRPVFWFNTGNTGNNDGTETDGSAVLLKLGGEDESSAIQAEVDGADYSVLNVSELGSEDAETYTFELI